MPKLSFNYLVYVLIFLVAALNYALMLGTLELIVGSYINVAALDLLRTEASFFLFIGFLASCFLINTPRLLWLRRTLVSLLCMAILLLVHMSAVLAQISSEAGPMHKVIFYVHYISNDWFTPSGFKFSILYLLPSVILLVAFLVYVYCVSPSRNAKRLRKKYKRQFLLALFFLMMGFIPPLQSQMPYSLSHNTLLYFLKTGYFPQKDIVTYDTNTHYLDWSIEKNNNHKKKNLVLIILESIQYKAIQTDANAKFLNLTPTLSEIAKRSMVFTQAYGSVPHTSKALTGIHCGILPALDLPIYASIYGLPVRCLPEILSEKGYSSVFMQSPSDKYENRRELLKQFGYQSIYSAEDFIGSHRTRSHYFGYEDKVLVDNTAKWLKENPDQPFFMTLLNLTTHHPYTVPEGFDSKHYVDHTAENDYLNTVSYMDSYLTELMAEFKKDDRYENTLFLFVSDHGQAFGEHGESFHNNVAYNEVSQLFFMIFDPAIETDQRLTPKLESKTVSQLQVLPSVLDLLDLSIKHQDLKMPSLFQKAGQAFGACYERFMCLFYANNDYKYIYNFREKPPELHHIKHDPQEQNNLASSEPEIAEKMHKILMDYYEFHQSAMHNYYISKNPNYDKEIEKTILYKIKDLDESLADIWP